jgi:hypothetical protein
LYGQDTISVFFKTGSAAIDKEQCEVLNSLRTNSTFFEVDSIAFIGMADSIGNFKSNFKLSEKRARNVAKFCKKFMSDSLPISTLALGERHKNNLSLNRRVDIVLYYRIKLISKNLQLVVADSLDSCFYVAYRLLNYCNIKTIIKGKKKYVVIESQFSHSVLDGYYCGSINSKGEFVAHLLKWKTKRTGQLWWAKARSIATIPQEDFDKFKIFNIGRSPCPPCCEDFKNEKRISKEEQCIVNDYFLMNNLQVKTFRFNIKEIKIRVPKEYVSINERYFYFHNKETIIQWDSINKKKESKYYFTVLPVNEKIIVPILKRMPCNKLKCYENTPFIDKYIGGILGMPPPNKYLFVNLEIGSNFLEKSISPYASLIITRARKHSYASLLTGVDINLNVFGGIRYDYFLFKHKYEYFTPSSGWHSTANLKAKSRTFSGYLGSELKAGTNFSDFNFIDQNVHAGLAYEVNKDVNGEYLSFYPRIFLQFGLGYDYLGNKSTNAYPFLQMGINLRLTSIKYKDKSS